MNGGIRHLNLRVRNLAESAAFYGDLFGMSARRPTPDRSGVLVCSPARTSEHPSFSIVLTQGLGGMTPTGMDHFAIGVASEADVDFAFGRAQAMGMRSTRPRMFDGNYQTFIFDPDGYKIEVFAELSAEPVNGEPEGDEAGSLVLAGYQPRAQGMCREAI